MTRLIDYFIRHRLAANIIMIMMILAGLVGALRMKQTFNPEIEFNQVNVSIHWPGASAEDVSEWLAAPLSSSLKSVNNVEEVFAYSSAGYLRMDVDVAHRADFKVVQEAITEQVERFDLPAGVEEPKVSRAKFQEIVFYTSLVGSDIEELRPIASELRDQLIAMGIPRVDLNGVQDQRLEVTVPISVLHNTELTIDQLAQQISLANRDYSASQVGEGFNSRSISSSGYSTELADLKAIPVQTSGGTLRLGDVADIQYSTIPGHAKLAVDGQPAIELQIYRDSTVDSVQVAGMYYPWFEQTNAQLPEGMQLVQIWDMAEFVVGSRNMLLQNAAMGLLLVLVLLFFMLNRHVAFWTAIGVPVSILGALAFLYSQDVSLNFFTIFSLLMALGIIVDDAIVVGEESLTQFQKGKSPHEAALLGAKRMFGPIMASSLTTIAAFSPLLFLPGVEGQALKPVPLVIICVVAASIIECFVILPAHLRHSFERMEKQKPSKLRVKIEQGIDWVRYKPYRSFATFALSHRFLTFSVTAAFVVLAFALVAGRVVNFNGDVDAENDQIIARASFVDGTPAEVIDAFVLEAREALQSANEQLSEEDLVIALVDERYYGSEFVFFIATLTPRDDRMFTTVEVLNKWRENMTENSWIDRLDMGEQQRGSGNANSIGFFLAGDVSLDTLSQAVDDLKTELERYPELQEVKDNIGDGATEVTFELLDEARSIGLNEADISRQIRLALDGGQVQTFVRHGRDTDIVVMLPLAERQDRHSLETLPIRTPSGTSVPLSTLVTFGTDTGSTAIFMQDAQIGAEVTANVVSDATTPGELTADIRENVLPNILEQYGLSAEFTGGSQSTQELLTNLAIAGAGALALIYLVLAWSFASWSWPLAVMSAIPLAITGAIFGHAALGIDLNPLSLFGFFALGGIIVNDSIILVSRYIELMKEGMERKAAIIEASVQRFRAVILTTLTTVFGLLPLLFETSVNAQLVRSMAVSLAFGLSFGTLLVLIIVPCLLSLIESSRHGVKRVFRRSAKA